MTDAKVEGHMAEQMPTMWTQIQDCEDVGGVAAHRPPNQRTAMRRLRLQDGVRARTALLVVRPEEPMTLDALISHTYDLRRLLGEWCASCQRIRWTVDDTARCRSCRREDENGDE